MIYDTTQYQTRFNFILQEEDTKQITQGENNGINNGYAYHPNRK